MNTGDNKWLPSGGGIEIFTLLLLYFFGFVFGAFAINVFLGGEAILDSIYNIRGANIIQAVFLFLIPTAIYALLFADNKGEFLVKSPLNIKILIFAVLTIFTILPFIETVNYYNELIPLPQDIQDIVKQALAENQKAYDLLFGQKTAANVLVNILVVAILPGIVEELFFRGCLQRSVIGSLRNAHIGIWVTAIVFSLLHFQIAGFFPRIILGALLGYLYYWTKNIWVPIIVHAANNASIVIVMQLLAEKDFYKKIQITDYSLSNAWPAAIISLLLTAGILYLIYRLKPESGSSRSQAN